MAHQRRRTGNRSERIRALFQSALPLNGSRQMPEAGSRPQALGRRSPRPWFGRAGHLDPRRLAFESLEPRVVLAAEIDVFGNDDTIGDDLSIPDNDTTPRAADGTDFGIVDTSSSNRRTFTIGNVGTVNALAVTEIKLSGPDASSFRIENNPAPRRVYAGQEISFDVVFDPDSLGRKTADVVIANSDSNENPYNFRITGLASQVSPEIEVRGYLSRPIADGDTSPSSDDGTDFGEVRVGTSESHTFSIANLGIDDLYLLGSPAVKVISGSEHWVVSDQPNDRIPRNTTTYFDLDFRPRSGGEHAAVIEIRSNDTTDGEDVHTFQVTGFGHFAGIVVTQHGGGAIENGITTIDLGTFEYGETATPVSFNVRNRGTSMIQIVDPESNGEPTVPSWVNIPDVLSNIIYEGSSDDFALKLKTNTVGTFGPSPVSFTTDDPTIGTFTFYVTGTVRVSNIDLELRGPSGPVLPRDPSSYAVGQFVVGQSEGVQLTFAITNRGRRTAQLSNLTVPEGFFLCEDFSQTQLRQDETATFVVRVDTSQARSLNGQLAFRTNDLEPEGQYYTVHLTGVVAVPAAPDDGVAPSVNLLAPELGTFYVGQTISIEGSARDSSGISHVEIELYRGGTAPGDFVGYIYQGAAGSGNTEQVLWEVPESLNGQTLNGTNYKIRWVAYDNTVALRSSGNASRRYLTILPAPVPAQADGLDYPVGKPDGEGWYNAQDFRINNHLGEDWNKLGGRDADIGQPVYAIANGQVTYARDAGTGWNGVVMIRHSAAQFLLPGGGTVTDVEAMHAHLDVAQLHRWVNEGDNVQRGQQIGVIGPTPAGSTGPHLHFEIRTTVGLGLGPGYSTNPSGRVDPSDFIDLNRPAGDYTSPTVSITLPADRSFEVGDTITVEGAANDASGISRVWIELYKGGTLDEHRVGYIYQGAPGSGGITSYEWRVPSSLGSEPINGDDYKLKWTARDSSTRGNVAVSYSDGWLTLRPTVAAADKGVLLAAAGSVAPTLTEVCVTSNGEVSERDAATKHIRFQIAIDGTPQDVVTVEYEVVDGTADVNEDYRALPGSPLRGTLTFQPREFTKVIEVEVINDQQFERIRETLSLNLLSAVNANIAVNTWTAGIVDDETTGETDFDGDGLPDSWEIEDRALFVLDGKLHELDLSGMGVNPLVPDVFVEIDHLRGPFDQHELAPDPTQLTRVQEVFREHGIMLHIDYGPDAPMTPGADGRWGTEDDNDPENLFDDRSGGDSILRLDRAVGTVKQGTSVYDWSEFESLFSDHFATERFPVFRYCLYVSGLGVNYGGVSRESDFIVTQRSSYPNDYKAGIFMHELGHTLGLGHGGRTDQGDWDHDNRKPNYDSVMDYDEQQTLLNFSELALANRDEVLEDQDLNGDGRWSVLFGREDWSKLDFAQGRIGKTRYVPDASKVSAGDLPLDEPASGQVIVVRSISDGGVDSLRQAIHDANSSPGTDTIVFDIAGSGTHAIQLLSALPELTDSVVIDATSQPAYDGWPLIEIDGSLVASAAGFVSSAPGTLIAGLAIHSFSGDGIVLSGPDATNNMISANFIGTDETGTVARPNGGAGVRITGGAHGNFVGANGDGLGDDLERNLIVGNAQFGVVIEGAGSDGNVVAGNWIGVDVSGAAALGNAGGVLIANGAASNVIGTDGNAASDAAERNVISGNHSDGVVIQGAGTDSNAVAGNYIGTDSNGMSSLGGQQVGVKIVDGAKSNHVGTNGDGLADLAERNLIAGNLGDGVLIGGVGTDDTVVAGNWIGVDASGGTALPNDHGVRLGGGAKASRIGTNNDLISDDRERNVISGNRLDGVHIADAGTDGNLIAGNFLGTDVAGVVSVANGANGISIAEGNGNTMGGTLTNSGNRIAFNTLDGVAIVSGVGNRILGNAIFENGELGIDLNQDGVTANDEGDIDAGGNLGQNFPILTHAASGLGVTWISGTLAGSPDTEYRLEFFATDTPDPSGFGEGNLFLGGLSTTTAADGNVAFVATLGVPVPVGYRITATATDAFGNTSEFSGTVTVDEPPSVEGTVWNDENSDGVRQGGEPRLSSIGVRLVDPAGGEVAAATTDSQGHYQLSAEVGSGYRVAVVLPSGLRFTERDQGGDDAIDSDVHSSSGRSDEFSFTIGQPPVIVDAGLLLPASEPTADIQMQTGQLPDPSTVLFTFDVSAETGSLIWLDGNDPYGDGTTPSGTISQWADKSGNGYDAGPVVSPPVINLPTFNAAGLNGLGTVSFNGAHGLEADFNFSTEFQAIDDYLTFTVFRTGTNAVSYLWADRPSDGPGHVLSTRFNGRAAVRGYSGTDPESDTVVTNNQGHLATFGFRAGSGVFAIDGVTQSHLPSPGGTSAPSPSTLIFGRRVNSDNGTNSEYYGQIAEFVLFGEPLTEQQQRDVTAHLGEKWGIAVPHGGNATQGAVLVARGWETFDVALFRSADRWRDSSDVQVDVNGDGQIDGSDVKTILGASELQSGQFDLAQPLAINPALPYLLVVADPGQLRSELDETNNVVSLDVNAMLRGGVIGDLVWRDANGDGLQACPLQGPVFAHDFEQMDGDSVTALQGPAATKTANILPDSSDPIAGFSEDHVQAPAGAEFGHIDTNTRLTSPVSEMTFGISYNARGDTDGTATLLTSSTGTVLGPAELVFDVTADSRLRLAVGDPGLGTIVSSEAVPRDVDWHQVGFVVEGAGYTPSAESYCTPGSLADLGWQQTARLTIDQDHVDEDLTGFPVLLRGEDLPATMFEDDLGFPAQADGGDLRFTSDAAGTQVLAAEVVSFGRKPAHEFELEPETIALWHMNGPLGSAGKLADAASRFPLKGKNAIAAANGFNRVGDGAFRFDGQTSHLQVDGMSGSVYGHETTIEAWIWMEALPQVHAMIYRDWDWDPYKFLSFSIISSGRLVALRGGIGGHADVVSETVLQPHVWYYVAATMKTGEPVRVYVNGQLDGESDELLSNPNRDGGTYNGAQIGVENYHDGLAWPFKGSIDEVRLSNTRKTSGEIAESYARSLEDTTEIYVRIPTISASSNTPFWAWWGHDEVKQQPPRDSDFGSEAVWASYALVQHMNDVTTASLEDSTAVHHPGTKQSAGNPIEAQGIAGYSQWFDEVSDFINSGSHESIDRLFAGGGAFSVWIHPESAGEIDQGTIFFKQTFQPDNTEAGWRAYVTDPAGGYMKFRFGRVFEPNSYNQNLWETEAIIPERAWTHVAVLYDEADVEQDPVILVNGVSVPFQRVLSATPAAARNDSNDSLYIGSYSANASVRRIFDGGIDEPRLFSTVPGNAEAWMKAEYCNVSRECGFLTRPPAGTVTFYLDGAQLGEVQTIGAVSIPAQTNDWFLIEDVTDFGESATEYFASGDYDEAVLWYRALGAEEINDLYQSGLSGTSLSPEPGMEGVRVRLLDSSGSLVGETLSDSRGHYEFGCLSEGQYQIEVVKPDGFAFSPQVAGGVAPRLFDVAGSADRLWDSATLPDGNSVLAGYVNDGGRTKVGLIRVSRTGELDPTFGNGAKVLIDPGTGEFNFNANIAVQADGKVVFCGVGSFGGNWELFLVRVNVDGSLDTTFGGGVVRRNFSTQREAHVGIRHDGSIVVGGISDRRFYVARFTANGAFVGSAFAGQGDLIDVSVNAVLVLPDDAVILGGAWQYADDSDTDFVLVKFTPTLTLDGSFGSSGIVRTGFGGLPPHNTASDSVMDLDVDSLGRIIAAGHVYTPSGRTGGIARYSANGLLDASFDADGRADLGSLGFNFLQAVAVLPDNRLLVAGNVDADTNVGVARVLEGGPVDLSFGEDGLAAFDFGYGYDWYPRLSVFSNADIGIGAYATGPSGTDFGFLVMNADGEVLPAVSDRDSDLIPATGRTHVFDLAAFEDNASIDAGLVPLGRVDGRVWRDEDADGLRDLGEPAKVGMPVKLVSPGGAVLAATTTDEHGRYAFPNLSIGDYVVEFVPNADYIFTLADQGDDDSVDSDAVWATGRTPVVPLTNWGDMATLDAGLITTRFIGDRVWEDLDGDGLQDLNEPGIDQVRVQAFMAGDDGMFGTSDDVLVADTTSDSFGAYHFADLADGQYRFVFTPPTGYVGTRVDVGDDASDSDIDPASRSVVVNVAGLHEIRDLDAGFYRPGTIAGQKWNDLDGDGTHDADEPGLNGWTIELTDGEGSAVATAVTGSVDFDGDGQFDPIGEQGRYSFAGLVPGVYHVREVVQQGWLPTYPLGEDVLLADDFNDNAIDSTKWTVTLPYASSSVVETGQRLEFTDRGYLISNEEFDPRKLSALRITGRWQHGDGVNPTHDYLQVLTRSDGVPTGNYGETASGIEFRYDGSELQIVRRAGDSMDPLSVPAPLAGVTGDEFEFEALDDGAQLRFTMIRLRDGKLATVAGESAEVFGHYRVVIHNRENTCFSVLDDFRLSVGGIGHTLVLASGEVASARDFGNQALPGEAPVVDLNGADPGIRFAGSFAENDLPAAIAGATATVTDADTLYLETIVATITNWMDGADEELTADVSGTSLTASYAAGTLTISGPAAIGEFQQVLRTLTYANASENPTPGQRTILVRASDGRHVGPAAVATVDVVAVNDAPTAVGPTSVTVTQGHLIPIGGLVLNDADLFAVELVDVTLTVSAGTVELSSLAGLTVLDGDNGSSSLQLRGVLPDLNAALATLAYVADDTFFGADTLVIGVDDAGQFGGGGVLTGEHRVSITVIDRKLIVTSLTPTVSGFVARFSGPVDAGMLNLYDSAEGTLGAADVTLVGASEGNVLGSMILSDGNQQITFVRTGGPLAADTYTVTLRSAENGFREPSGETLDGNADGTTGDHYQTTFTVAARPAGTVTISLPDFAFGAGQSVAIPNAAAGLPLRIDHADGVTSLAVDLVYDQTLLAITAATLAAGLPGDWSVVNPPDTSTPGVAKIRASGTTPLSGSDLDVVRLTAAVPSAAAYGASQAIRLENVSLNGGTIAAVGDVAVHKAAYLGDADGSAIHSSADAFLTVQAALGLASGFAAHAWTDPLIVGDADGSGVLSAADAFLIVQEGVGLPEPFVPDNPHIPITPVGGGVDPQFRIDANLPTSVGGLVSVPVKLAIEAAATNVGAIEFDLFFDPAWLTIDVPDGVSAGADTAGGWAISARLIDAGHLRVGMIGLGGQPLAPGLREIARLQFRVEAERAGRTGWQPVPDGLPTRPTLLPPITDDRLPITDLSDGSETHPTWLDIEPVDPHAGGYTWTDADGSVLIRPAVRAPAGAARERVWRDLDAKADLLESMLADLD